MSEEHIRLRIKFEKTGVVRFIGHLDIMRYFQKVNRRAGIDIAYSAGFSPHQILSFASPLGVGLESYGEYMDVEMCSVTSSEDIMNRMNAENVPGIRVVNVVKLPEKAENAMASVAAARYRVRFREGYEPDFNVRVQLPKFYGQEQIPYHKETKKGTREINLKEAIYECFVTEQGEIEMLVNASSAGNIKPSMVMEAFYCFCGVRVPEFAWHITRMDTYLNNGDETQPVFVPLDAAGERF
ncbi:MAG: TIGR03936 family radical SAM-associated protein [Lachnospiraceae bacterium]|nr:TIGR03936 family radical SAM-associated protein [Lachnospiraceae bacterium]